MPRIFHKYIPQEPGDPTDWLPDFPNPADFRFDYYKLLSPGSPIGNVPSEGKSVAIIGAGAAGMTAARELFRAGYYVTIYEASPRIGGRHHTVPVSGQSTGMELGAMRFPFFSDPGSKNSVTDYFFNDEAPGLTAPFPNPGVAPGGTGIYVNQGFGPNDEFAQPTMILWPNDSPAPKDPYLSEVHTLVDTFITFFTKTVKDPFLTDEWPAMWRQIAGRYDKMTVSDLVFAPPITTYNNDGWLGGFGMNQQQSELFYVIGAGDGSWGPFYEIGAMWFIRCVMFGFNSNLQTLIGMNDAATLPYYNDASLVDTAGNPLPPPLYSGIQSLAEWLLYVTPPAGLQSLFESCEVENGGSGIFVNDPVKSIAYNNDDTLTVRDSLGYGKNFDYVVLTPQIWASQLGVALENFPRDILPQAVISARNEQHVIASAKVFFPLTETYWNTPGCNIPQIIVTDTLVQDAYGMQWSNDDPGVLLASYTWEDDALKLLPYNDQQVAQMVLDQLDAITSSTLNDSISNYVDRSAPFVWQWSEQVGYSGCAKLYRQRNWNMNYALLAYNQQYSSQSRLYLAGETFSVEGGWTEPALRLALDAVIRIIHDSGGTFNNGFDMNDYPLFDVDFQPNEEYNVDLNDT